MYLRQLADAKVIQDFWKIALKEPELLIIKFDSVIRGGMIAKLRGKLVNLGSISAWLCRAVDGGPFYETTSTNQLSPVRPTTAFLRL